LSVIVQEKSEKF